MSNYVLDAGGRPQLEPDIIRWARWFERTERRIVAKTQVGPMRVSTVFLGIDHNFGGGGDPVLWESMIFDAPDGDDHMRRYRSRLEAEAGHVELVAEAKALAALEAAP